MNKKYVQKQSFWMGFIVEKSVLKNSEANTYETNSLQVIGILDSSHTYPNRLYTYKLVYKPLLSSASRFVLGTPASTIITTIHRRFFFFFLVNVFPQYENICQWLSWFMSGLYYSTFGYIPKETHSSGHRYSTYGFEREEGCYSFHCYCYSVYWIQ